MGTVVKQQLVTPAPGVSGMDWELGERQSPVDLPAMPQPWQVLCDTCHLPWAVGCWLGQRSATVTAHNRLAAHVRTLHSALGTLHGGNWRFATGWRLGRLGC
jgi:hypothetical protein